MKRYRAQCFQFYVDVEADSDAEALEKIYERIVARAKDRGIDLVFWQSDDEGGEQQGYRSPS